MTWFHLMYSPAVGWHMRRILVILCCSAAIAAIAIWFRPGADQLGEPQVQAAPPDPLRDAVARLQRELETEVQLRARGLNTDWDVDFHRAILAEARHDAAALRGDREEMGNQLRVLVGVWQRYWERMAPGVEHGTTSPIEAEDARRGLAAARYRLAAFEGRRTDADEQLALVAAAADRRVERLTQAYDRRAAGLRDLNQARYVAGCARYVRALAGGRTDDVRREIDRSITLWKTELERVNRVHGSGAASHFEHYQARHFLATARLRLATLDQDRAAAANQLRARIQVDDEFLARLTPTDPFLRRIRPSFEWERDFDRHCLSRLEREGGFPPDTAAAELDW
jgi:outer membrane protein TolC